MKNFIVVALLMASIFSLAQEPELLLDINTDGADGFDYSPEMDTISFKGKLFFVVDTEEYGEELWRTDGTPAGTQLVKDIRPGQYDSDIEFIGATNNRLFFIANDGEHGDELWSSEGTESSTKMVMDIQPGYSGSINTTYNDAIILNNILYFSAYGPNGTELYRSEGDEDNTSLVTDINPGISSSNPRGLTIAGNTIYFRASDATNGTELWMMDGSTDEVTMIKDINPGQSGSNIYDIIASGSGVYFELQDTTPQLWYSDGTEENTYLVKSFDNTASSLTLVHTTLGSIYFTVNETNFKKFLWKSDGTEFGTTKLEGDLRYSSHIMYGDTMVFYSGGSLYEAWGYFAPKFKTITLFSNMVRMGDKLYFGARTDASNGIVGLWETDGTDEGTKEVVGISDRGFGIRDLIAVNNQLFFVADIDSFGLELWTSDGTAEGTYIINDGTPGPESSYSYSEDMIYGKVNDKLVYAGVDDEHGKELWISDGSIEGTSLLKDLNTSTDDIDLNGFPIEFNGSVYFTTAEGFWKTNGSDETTQLIKEFSFAGHLNIFKNKIYFTARDTNFKNVIYASDGTETGTNIFIGTDTVSNYNFYFYRNLPKTGDYMYFVGYDSEHGRELWLTDGTIEGTRMIKDINEGIDHSMYNIGDDWYAINNDILYFVAEEPNTDSELWKTDGTEGGTMLVRDINPFGPTYFDNFAVFNNEIYFVADDGTSGRELWKTDGTADGTGLVKELSPGDANGVDYSSMLLVANNWLFFEGNTIETGSELWKTDGTEQGTTVVKDIYPGASSNNYAYSSNPTIITRLNNRVLFTAHDTIDTHIYVSDGTEEGTYPVSNIRPSDPDAFEIINNQILFEGRDEEFNPVIWRMDTSFTTAAQITDSYKEMNFNISYFFGFMDGSLYFLASNNVVGAEIWTLTPLELQAELITSNTSLCNEEDTVSFETSITNPGDSTQITWYVNNEIVDDDSNTSIQISNLNNGDEVKIKVTGDNSLWYFSNEVFTKSISIDIKQFTAEISFSNNELTATEGISYQWFLDGQPMDVNNREITVAESGTYRVEITNEQGCSAISNELNIIISGVEQEDLLNKNSVYPNPFEDKIFVSSTNEKIIEVEIYNIGGSALITEIIEPGQRDYGISTDRLLPGIYFVRLVSEENSKTIRVVKN